MNNTEIYKAILELVLEYGNRPFGALEGKSEESIKAIDIMQALIDCELPRAETSSNKDIYAKLQLFIFKFWNWEFSPFRERGTRRDALKAINMMKALEEYEKQRTR